MKVTYYLVRHGETLFNQLGRMQGCCDSPLTEKGIKQANATAAVLKDIWFDRIYASPSERAWDTANILSSHRDQKPVLMSGLHEINFGKLEGTRFTSHSDEITACMQEMDFSSAGGESNGILENRIRETLRTIQTESEDGDRILLVGHGMYQLCVMKFLLGEDIQAYREKCSLSGAGAIPNGGIMVFTYEDGKYEMHCRPTLPEKFQPIKENKTVHFYFVRHGQTLFNHYNRMQGRCDSPLTAEGIEQVKTTGKALRNVHFSFAYCSTAERARDTAAYILQSHHIEAVPSKDLREINFGTYEGKIRDSVMDELYRRFNPTVDFTDLGGENEEQVTKRIQRILSLVVARAKDQDNVLLVAHGSLYISLLKYLFGILRADITEQKKSEGKHVMPNGGICTFTYENGAYRLDQPMITPEEFMK